MRRLSIQEIDRRSRWLLCEGLGLANFLSFVAIAMMIGGSAAFGKVDAPGYWLGDHGRFTQVSAVVYWYSAVHGATQLITFPLAVVAMIKLAMSKL